MSWQDKLKLYETDYNAYVTERQRVDSLISSGNVKDLDSALKWREQIDTVAKNVSNQRAKDTWTQFLDFGREGDNNAWFSASYSMSNNDVGEGYSYGGFRGFSGASIVSSVSNIGKTVKSSGNGDLLKYGFIAFVIYLLIR